MGRISKSASFWLVISCIGAAAGLGNIWRFPYVSFTNGGGAFMLPYLIAVFAIGFPLMVMEMRAGMELGPSAAHATGKGRSGLMRWIGWWALTNSLVIVGYYVIVLSWALRYTWEGMYMAWGDDPKSHFLGKVLGLTDSPEKLGSLSWVTLLGMLILWSAIYWICTGGRKRLRKVLIVTVFLPVIILVILCVRAVTLPGGVEGIQHHFAPDFSKIGNQSVWLAAISQAVLSLGLGMGQVIAYASKWKVKGSGLRESSMICVGDVLVSLLGGVVVFGALGFYLHSMSLPMDAEVMKKDGIFLAFISYPVVLTQMPLAPLFATLFFGTLVLLGIDSAFAVIEAVKGGFQSPLEQKAKEDQRTQKKITLVLCLVGFGLGVFYLFGNGLYLLDIVDHYVAYYAIAAIIVLQALVLTYGLKSEAKNKLWDTKTGLPGWMRWYCGIIIPTLLVLVFGANILDELKLDYGGYPKWMLLMIGWGSMVLAVGVAIVLGRKSAAPKPD